MLTNNASTNNSLCIKEIQSELLDEMSGHDIGQIIGALGRKIMHNYKEVLVGDVGEASRLPPICSKL